MFKRLLPEERAEQNSGSATALVYFYFWFSGVVLFLAAAYGVYELIRHMPGFSVVKIIFVLFMSFLFMIGAWLIGRFDRRGVIVIAIGVSISVVEWIFYLPKTSDVAFTAVTVIALIIAWQDLSSSPLRSSKN